MITVLTNIIASESFRAFATIFGLGGDLAILILTIYTLYITAFSKKLELVSPSFRTSAFEGESMSLTFMNKSLHAIPIQKVFIMKKGADGIFLYMLFADLQNPLSIDSWSVKRVDMEPYTKICNSDTSGDKRIYPHKMMMDAIIGVEAGKDLIWVKTNKKAPLKGAKKAYKKHDYQIITAYRKIIDGKICSETVDCLIYVRLKDLNGHYTLHRNFGITGFDEGKSVCLSDYLFGYNYLPCPGRNADEITKTIHETFGIDEKDINVQMIGKGPLL